MNESFVVSIQENDEIDWYNLSFLNVYLMNVKTRFEDLNWDESSLRWLCERWKDWIKTQ